MGAARLMWSLAHASATRVVGDHLLVIVHEPRGSACLDRDGRQVWRTSLPVVMVVGDRILSQPPGDPLQVHWLKVSDGTLIASEPSTAYPIYMLANGSFVGFRAHHPDRRPADQSLVGFSLGPEKYIWESRTASQPGVSDKGHLWTGVLAFNGRDLFAPTGKDLRCLEASTGKPRWTAPFAAIGGSMLSGVEPLVRGDVVVAEGPEGTMAVDIETGLLRWTLNFFGNAGYSDGRIYYTSGLQHGMTLVVVEALSGKVLEHVPLREKCERYLRERGPKAASIDRLTAPAIVGDRLFCGDNYGRLWALDRKTGDPLWHHRPKDASCYVARAPMVVGNRLYANSFSMDPKRLSTLYCYEIA